MLIGENFAREYWGSARRRSASRSARIPTTPGAKLLVWPATFVMTAWKRKPRGGLLAVTVVEFVTYLIRGPRAGTDSFPPKSVSRARGGQQPADHRDANDEEVYGKSMSRTATLTLAISGRWPAAGSRWDHAVISYTVAQRTREIGTAWRSRATGQVEDDVRSQRPPVERNRRSGGINSGRRAFTADVHAALRDQPGRSSDIFGRCDWLARSGGGGQLFAGPPGHARRPCGSASGRVNVHFLLAAMQRVPDGICR